MKMAHGTIRKILYINLAFIGDVLLSTPTIRALRQQYPNAVIDMLVIPWAAQAAVGNPYVNHVYTYDKKGEHRNLKNLWKLILKLRSNHYDIAITTNFAPRGALLAKAIGARVRVGYDTQHAGLFLTHTVSASRVVVRHETENQLAVVKPLGITTSDFSLAFKHNPVDIENMEKKIGISANKAIVVICPFGRHPLNSWSIQGYVDVLTALSRVASCYLIGGTAEKERLDEINGKAGFCGRVLAGELSIGELAAFLVQSSLVITVDTGPMHLAAAVGVPILALFGRSDVRVWGPRAACDQVIKVDLDCAPCITPRECQHHSCMKGIKSDMVIGTALKMLATKRS